MLWVKMTEFRQHLCILLLVFQKIYRRITDKAHQPLTLVFVCLVFYQLVHHLCQNTFKICGLLSCHKILSLISIPQHLVVIRISHCLRRPLIPYLITDHPPRDIFEIHAAALCIIQFDDTLSMDDIHSPFCICLQLSQKRIRRSILEPIVCCLADSYPLDQIERCLFPAVKRIECIVKIIVHYSIHTDCIGAHLPHIFQPTLICLLIRRKFSQIMSCHRCGEIHSFYDQSLPAIRHTKFCASHRKVNPDRTVMMKINIDPFDKHCVKHSQYEQCRRGTAYDKLLHCQSSPSIIPLQGIPGFAAIL